MIKGNKTKAIWKEVHGIRLHKTHKQILSTSQWLDDDIITVCQHLLKEHHPLVGGLQPVVLAEKLAMQPELGEFVQILNAGRSHWMTVSTIGCAPGEINIYDSLHLKLSSTNKKVVSDLMMYKGQAITVNYIDVQWQSGGADCGLFAIAFATVLCFGHDPSKLLYHQQSMRHHLVNCIDLGHITPFSERAIRRRVQKPYTEQIPVFCVCQLPDGKTMIQ